LDLDKDGDKEEPMADAAEDKKEINEESDCAKCEDDCKCEEVVEEAEEKRGDAGDFARKTRSPEYYAKKAKESGKRGDAGDFARKTRSPEYYSKKSMQYQSIKEEIEESTSDRLREAIKRIARAKKVTLNGKRIK
jgi:hypothetical protein